MWNKKNNKVLFFTSIYSKALLIIASLCREHTCIDLSWGCLPQPGTKRRGEGILELETFKLSAAQKLILVQTHLPSGHVFPPDLESLSFLPSSPWRCPSFEGNSPSHVLPRNKIRLHLFPLPPRYSPTQIPACQLTLKVTKPCPLTHLSGKLFATSSKNGGPWQSGFQYTYRPRPSSPELFNENYNAGPFTAAGSGSIPGRNKFPGCDFFGFFFTCKTTVRNL